MSYKKILTIFILILSLIIAGEFYYLFVFKNQTETSSTPQSVPPLRTELDYFPSPQPDQALNEGSLINLRKLKKGVVTSSILTYKMEGTIDKIEYLQQGESKGIEVTIKGSNGNTSGFRFPNVSYVTVTDVKNEQVDIFTVKKDDSVVITVEFDIMNSEYQSIIIHIT